MLRNITNMAKLFVYPSYVHSYAKLMDASVIDIVKRELANFPYQLKENLTVRIFSIIQNVYIKKQIFFL